MQGNCDEREEIDEVKLNDLVEFWDQDFLLVLYSSYYMYSV